MKAQQLKNAILQLAISGKLVPQDPNDEPASELLCKIQAEKDRLIAEGKIKKSKKSADKAPYSKIEPPFDIPESWVWVRLDDICEFNPKKDIEGKDIPLNSWVLDLEDIEKESGVLLRKKIKTQNNIKSQKNSFEENDILYGKLRPYLNKVIIATDKGFCSTEIVPLKFTINFYNRFAQIVLMSPYFLSYAKQNSHGTKMPRFNLEKGKEFLFPLPPLNEQHRIVAKIEDLLPFIEQYDQKEQQLTALNKNFPEQLKKSILQAAIQGKLTEQLPTDEPASELLKRIQVEKARLISEKKLKKPKHTSEIIIRDNLAYEIKDGVENCIADEIPFEIPESWCWVRLGNYLDVRDGTHDTPKYVEKGYPLVTSKNLVNGNLDFSNVKFISREDHLAISLRSKVNVGDILFAMIGSIGNPVLVKKELEFSIKNVALFKPYIKQTNMDYIFYVLSFYQNEMKNVASGGVQSFISLSFLREFIIPLPPLNEQHRIVAKIEQLLSNLQKLE
ncbi:type I restriction-modification system subunit S [Actinobacillus porcinus]|uniref:Type I restriction-modification system subunit S n=1 Tax=Actinobacillus porcinus TaxID=51048 RepID=A0ABY6TJV8_9PAST|nr:restriction endonuclease subunit S [Actinobacillus porcinus]VFY93212.1 type I restriction-modification system subunit S [Actinobacillus porcinus]VTU08013.1 type I restriction-modification system subunit S [Actinobacillus porcinus]